MDLEQLGSGAQIHVETVLRKRVLIFNRLCGWIRTWGMGRGQTVLRK